MLPVWQMRYARLACGWRLPQVRNLRCSCMMHCSAWWPMQQAYISSPQGCPVCFCVPGCPPACVEQSHPSNPCFPPLSVYFPSWLCAGLSVGKAIRGAEKDKVPVMCVIGQREAEQGAVAVRTYAAGDLGTMPKDELIARLVAANNSRGSSL